VSNDERGAPEPADADVHRLRKDYAANVDNRVQAALLAVLALGAMLYPVLIRRLADHFGVRIVAAIFAVAGGLSVLRAPERRSCALRAAAAAVPASAVITGTVTPLLWVPAILYANLALLFLASLATPVPLVLRAARAIQPAVPEFVAPYCRRVTLLWGVIFALNAVVLAIAPWAVSPAAWERLAGYGVWTWMGAVTIVEFLVRKTYFRNYWYRGPFERFWSRLFPAEATPMGRRSAEYIRETRRKLGLDD